MEEMEENQIDDIGENQIGNNNQMGENQIGENQIGENQLGENQMGDYQLSDFIRNTNNDINNTNIFLSSQLSILSSETKRVETIPNIKMLTSRQPTINTTGNRNLYEIEATINTVTNKLPNREIRDALNGENNYPEVLKNDFKTLYNKQYLLNVEMVVGILLIGGFITKMLFYETISLTKPKV